MAEVPDTRIDARMDRMEVLIRDIEARQHTLQAGQKTFLWAVGLIGAFVAAIIGGLVTLDLSRIFTLGDRLATVETNTGQMTTAFGFLSGDVSAIKADVKALPEIQADVKALRLDLQRVADAVGAQPPSKQEEKKTQLLPR
jgi:hypothetical protein